MIFVKISGKRDGKGREKEVRESGGILVEAFPMHRDLLSGLCCPEAND